MDFPSSYLKIFDVALIMKIFEDMISLRRKIFPSTTTVGASAYRTVSLR